MMMTVAPMESVAGSSTKLPRRHIVPTKGELLTVAEAANYIGIASGTMRNWLSAGRLPYHKVGRLTKVSRRDLDDYIAARRIEATNADLN